ASVTVSARSKEASLGAALGRSGSRAKRTTYCPGGEAATLNSACSREASRRTPPGTKVSDVATWGSSPPSPARDSSTLAPQAASSRSAELARSRGRRAQLRLAEVSRGSSGRRKPRCGRGGSKPMGSLEAVPRRERYPTKQSTRPRPVEGRERKFGVPGARGGRSGAAEHIGRLAQGRWASSPPRGRW